mmetsp:Transcript_9595/g.8579  ORF Transcript_9595/g.8579 Transcript_9595/m.8579 type:complete len:189 (-) Transcript_9595:12-578(-)
MNKQQLVVNCLGYIESGEFGDLNDLYCRYNFHIGPDWTIIGGIDSGISQTSVKRFYHNSDIIWNFPIDISFKSTNIFGWPRLVISVYGLDYFGRDVIRGYGSALIPLVNGSHAIDVEMYSPIASSLLNQVFSWVFGNPPEFFDSKIVALSEGREVTRVQYAGRIRIKLNIKTKGFQAAGYSIADDNNL